MNGVNMVIMLGNLGQDPEVKYTRDGTAVANLSLAVNERWKNKDGEQQERTEWVRAVCWAKLAEVCKEYLHKGDPVYIQGKMQTRSWEDKDGNKRYTTEVRVDQLQMLGSRRNAEGDDRGGGGGRGEERPEPFQARDEDVPF